MRCLPTLTLAGQPVQLPLCDGTAELLIAAMLADEPSSTVDELRGALAVDPALALWSLIQCNPPATSDNGGRAQPPLSTRLVTWLSAALPECFDVEEPAGFPVSRDDGDEFAEFVEHVCASAAKMREDPRGVASEWLTAEQAASLASRWDGESCEPLEVDDDAAIRAHWQRSSASAALVYPLAARLSRLASLEERFDRELHEAKLRAMYTLAAGAGHEINNPLGSIAGRAQLLLRDEPDAQRRRTLAKINAQAFRAHEMISDMMLFARPPAPELQEIDLGAVAAEVVEELHERAEAQGTRLTLKRPAEPVRVSVDPTQLAVALQALCVNALEARGNGGHVEVGFDNVSRNGFEPRVELFVADDGPGIEPEQREQLFDPFYSGREAGRGMGFGLSKCWRIVTNHGGEIRVESEPGHGARFALSLPAATP
ncbi:MAG: sensor histidine kinase [Planctomycetota bacterium]|nr:MAG: sensor histidine kinase [Planctomycetota bacterium]REJ89398.1 MAG: sensor histidine kinase [Planctomycetota bacterium]REK26196.1 MAG: sensor histidine kinase [Planctomycetota bacterium]REK44528.1 MAG: sensor histidine kinase [Planctomycetota bacterium]